MCLTQLFQILVLAAIRDPPHPCGLFLLIESGFLGARGFKVVAEVAMQGFPRETSSQQATVTYEKMSRFLTKLPQLAFHEYFMNQQAQVRSI